MTVVSSSSISNDCLGVPGMPNLTGESSPESAGSVVRGEEGDCLRQQGVEIQTSPVVSGRVLLLGKDLLAASVRGARALSPHRTLPERHTSPAWSIRPALIE